MDLKRVIIVIISIIIIAIIIFGVYFFIKEKNIQKEEITEYTPEEEISDNQMRQTMISLYFKSDNVLIPEARLIDVKELINNPYEKVLNMLIEGPKNEKLERTIPEGTKINKIEKEADTLIIDFSKEFIENHKGDEMQEKLTINSIVNTVTELKEINSVVILIDGKENQEFPDGQINFKEIFKR